MDLNLFFEIKTASSPRGTTTKIIQTPLKANLSIDRSRIRTSSVSFSVRQPSKNSIKSIPNSFNTEATFVQSTRRQRFLKSP